MKYLEAWEYCCPQYVVLIWCQFHGLMKCIDNQVKFFIVRCNENWKLVSTKCWL